MDAVYDQFRSYENFSEKYELYSRTIQTEWKFLDKLDVIECFESPGQKLRIGELLEKQKELYKNFGVSPPASLWVNGNAGRTVIAIATPNYVV